MLSLIFLTAGVREAVLVEDVLEDTLVAMLLDLWVAMGVETRFFVLENLLLVVFETRVFVAINVGFRIVVIGATWLQALLSRLSKSRGNWAVDWPRQI